jgi:anti-anti-sigma regulatory factor
MEQYKTENGDRPDLAVLPVAQPIGYVGGMVFPTANVFQKAGTVNYQGLVADSSAQTNRAQGAAPSATVIAEATSEFSCGERIKRYVVDWTRVLSYGGVPGSDRVGSKAAKRSVLNSLETAQLAVLIDAAGTDITSSIIDGILGAAYAVRRYSGKLAFVCNQGTYRYMIQQSAITALLSRSFTNLSAEQVMSLSPDVFKAMLKGLFAFDEVLIGDDAFWPATRTYTAAVCKIPDGTDPESHLIEPELGRTMVYLPEGGSQWTVSSFADEDIRSNVYDAMVWDSIEQFNSGAKSLVKLSNVVTTTG